MNETVAEIAKRVLNVETLATRKMDSLDFHGLAVWQLRDALEAAYRAGVASVTTSAK